MDEHRLYKWRQPHPDRILLETVDKIKYDEERSQGEPPIWDAIEAFCAVLVLNSYDKEANDLLSAFFSVSESALQLQNQNTDNDLFTTPAEREWLEVYWGGNVATDPSARSQRPTNVSWPAWDAEKLASCKTRAEFNPEHVRFYETWTKTEWMAKTYFTERGQNITIDNTFDVHQWKESTDAWIVAICACLLCKPAADQIPSKESIEEACDALDHLFFDLPRRGDTSIAESNRMPHRHMVSPKVHFLLANHLGRTDNAQKIVKAAARLDPTVNEDHLQDFALHHLIGVPQFHDLLQSTQNDAPIRWVDADTARSNADLLIKALKVRADLGRQDAFPDVSWAELLRRFSEALFLTKRKVYKRIRENDKRVPMNSPTDILLPPLTTGEISEVEERLGPIPQDLKEMSLVARGFRGGWHFAGGGFPGIDQMANRPVMEYEAYIDEIYPKKIVVKTEQREKRMPDGSTKTITMHHMGYPRDLSFGDLLQCPGAVECDDFEHVIVPPAIWKTIKGDNYVEGSYRYFHMAHWTAGSDHMYDSIRQWIESMTRQAELALTLPESAQNTSESFGSAEDEDEDEDDGDGEEYEGE